MVIQGTATRTDPESTEGVQAVDDPDGAKVGDNVVDVLSDANAKVELAEGTRDGIVLGGPVGAREGAAEGCRVGAELGAKLGSSVGATVGAELGTALGIPLGAPVGIAEGTAVGD